jgi:dihydroorotate dehydrogenase
MSIGFEKGNISDVVVSTALGPSGKGMFPYTYYKEYRKLLKLVKEQTVTVFTKSSTRYPRVGNFRIRNPLTWKYIQKISKRGMLNAYGLTNNGVEVNAMEITDSHEKGFNVIPSYYPEFDKGIHIAIRELDESIQIYLERIGLGFWAIELNGSCPNSKEVISKNMDMLCQCVAVLKRKYPWLVVIVKTSIVHPYDFYKRLENVGADVIHAINTVPYNMVFPGSVSPLEKKGGGGVSGEPAFLLAYKYNEKLRKETSLPIIMACGVTDILSKVMFLRAGADSVGICTIALLNSKEAGRIIMPPGFAL